MMNEREQIAKLQAQVRTLSEDLQRAREFDALTGLYNQDAFCRKVRESIDGNPDCSHVIVCLDIEHFKLFKNTYGQEAGDRLLLHAAGLFSGKASDHGGIASRFFSDIFALYLPGPLIDLATIESEALDWFSSYSADQRVIPAIGVNVIEDPTVSVSVMCDRALIALGSVKHSYIRHIAEYHNDFGNELLKELELTNSAEKALRERQFEVYLQPKCNIETGRIIGSEALVRWNHPQYGMVSPGVFIPLFEKSGFIIKLDAYVWEEVCSFIRQWMDAGHTPIPASVNVSRRDLYTPNLCDRLERLVSKYDIPPHLLELEITESAYVEDTDQMIDVIDRLREKGFVILMDDFGSGYSSLNILKDINVDILKIDLRFLEDLNSSGKKGQNILESIVHLSKWLNMQVIAEGVETQEQVDFLSKIGCYYAQGFRFYRPMPRHDFEALLACDERVDYAYSVKNDMTVFSYEDLFQSGAMSQLLLNNILGGIALYEFRNDELFLQRANAGYYRITHSKAIGTNSEGHRIFQWVHPQDVELLRDALGRAVDAQEDGFVFEIRRYCPDGRLLWLQVRMFFLAENLGRRLFYASVKDITEQKEAEARAEEAERRLNLALEFAKGMLFDYDIAAGTIVGWNEWLGSKPTGEMTYHTNAPECFVENGTVFKDDVPQFLAMYRAVAAGAENAACEIRIGSDKADYVWKRISLRRLDVAGSPGKVLGFIEAVSERRKLEDRLAKGEKMLEVLQEQNRKIGNALLHEAVPYGMTGVYCEEGYPLYFVNDEFLRLLGYDSYADFAASTGERIVSTIHPEDVSSILRSLTADLAEGDELSLEYRTIRKDGSTFWTFSKCRVVLAEDGRLAVISVCLDISGQRELRSELDTIISDSPGDIVMFSGDGDDSTFTSRHVSFGIADVLGYTRQEYQERLGQRCGMDFVYPADREPLRLQLFRAMRQSTPVNINFRAQRKDGGTAWLNLSARSYQMGDGKAVYHGIYTDITELKEKEESLLLSDRRFQVALTLVEANLWEYHFDTRTIVQFHQNERWVEGDSDVVDVPDSLIRSKVVHPESAANYRMLFYALENGREQNSSEVRILGADGQYHWFLITCTVVQRCDDGKPLRAIGISKGIDAQKQQMLHFNELLQNTRFDGLTGLLNREAFHDAVQPGIEQFRAHSGRCPALLIMDIDNFKNINDSYGHIKGDEMLKVVGSVIKEVFGDSRPSGRLGGDEFSVFIDDAVYESDVYTLAQRFCDRLTAERIERDECRTILTASVGIVFLKDAQRDFSDVYKKADIALYRAKSLGKNMYSIYTNDEQSQLALYFNMNTSVLDELEDPLCIVDQSTCSVLYCNAAMLQLQGLSDNGWHGKTCHELFQNRVGVCPGCLQNELRYDSFTATTIDSVALGRQFEVREKLIRWNGRDLRLMVMKVKE